MTPDALTVRLLGGSRRQTSWGCGCEFLSNGPSSWVLCQYHQAYDDGVEAARREIAETLARYEFHSSSVGDRMVLKLSADEMRQLVEGDHR